MSDEREPGKETITTGKSVTVEESKPANPSKVDNFILLVYQIPTRILLTLMLLLFALLWEIRPDAQMEKLLTLIGGAWLLAMKLDSTQKP